MYLSYRSCNFGCTLSVDTIRFKIGFALANKGWIEGGGQVLAWGAMHMAAGLASTGWSNSFLFLRGLTEKRGEFFSASS